MNLKSDSRLFRATLDSLYPIREFLTNKGKAAGLEKSRIYKLCLAVDEIATNIITYGYTEPFKTKGTIKITVNSDEKVLTVICEDFGVPFNPLKIPLPSDKDLSLPLEERPTGGLGIMLAIKNVDELIYRYENKKNINIFHIRL
jgi:serine/threonine-protein kinase RsbW